MSGSSSTLILRRKKCDLSKNKSPYWNSGHNGKKTMSQKALSSTDCSSTNDITLSLIKGNGAPIPNIDGISSQIKIELEKDLNLKEDIERSQFEERLNREFQMNEDEFAQCSMTPVSSANKKKNSRDPLSHRIIEKRRRDRMNNCLADLARLLPQSSMKKGRGRIEKTEIVDQAIRHIQHLEKHLGTPCTLADECPHYVRRTESPAPNAGSQGQILGNSARSSAEEIESYCPNSREPEEKSPTNGDKSEFSKGFQVCLNETVRFLVDLERWLTPAGEPICTRLVQHLNTTLESQMPKNDLKPKTEAFPYPKFTPLSQTFSKMYSPTLKSEDFVPEIGGTTDPAAVISNYSSEVEMSSEEDPASTSPLCLHIPKRSHSQISEDQPEPLCLTAKPINGFYQSPSSSVSSLDYSISSTSPIHRGGTNSNGLKYKFKNKIKQRFKEDSNNSVERMTTPRPAFALIDPKKQIYVPMTLDEQMVDPFVRAFESLERKKAGPLALHPVTISVCFAPSLLYGSGDEEAQ